MKTKKPGIFRVLSLFLALLILVNLPIFDISRQKGGGLYELLYIFTFTGL